MKAVEGTGAVVSEPAWALILSDELEAAAAAEYWTIITTEMRGRETLSPTNRHAIQRLVLAYIIFDRAAREVVENGIVTRPKRGNARAIARLTPAFGAMRELDTAAANLEAELGLAPRRRAAAGKVQRNGRTQRPSDDYLRPVRTAK